MSFASLLDHTVTIVREPPTGDPDDDDEYGQPVTTPIELATVRASIQPVRAIEAQLSSQAGAVAADYTIFMAPTDITTADAIIHDALICRKTPDLPSGRFEVLDVPDAAGRGHHLQVAAKRIAGVEVAGS